MEFYCDCLRLISNQMWQNEWKGNVRRSERANKNPPRIHLARAAWIHISSDIEWDKHWKSKKQKKIVMIEFHRTLKLSFHLKSKNGFGEQEPVELDVKQLNKLIRMNFRIFVLAPVKIRSILRWKVDSNFQKCAIWQFNASHEFYGQKSIVLASISYFVRNAILEAHIRNSRKKRVKSEIAAST